MRNPRPEGWRSGHAGVLFALVGLDFRETGDLELGIGQGSVGRMCKKKSWVFDFFLYF